MQSRYACTFCVLLTLAPFASAQKLVPPPDASTRVHTLFARFDRPGVPGCAIGVSIDDSTVLRAAYGMADLEHNVPLTPDSVFEPGSITKQFTAAAVLLLAQDGKLSLDDPISRYFPELPAVDSTITIRNLMNHTSGLRDWSNLVAIAGWPRTTRANSNANVLDIAARQNALNYPPGDAYSYTNTGYNLLAILVARVSGQSLADFTHERIFVPLGMSSTQWRDDFHRIVPNRAIAYSQTGGEIKELMPFENAHGNGGLLTTVDDLLRWNANFTTMKVGGPAFVEAQVHQARLNDGRTIAYAEGLEVVTWKGLREVSHSGSTAGYQAWLGRYPGQSLSVAVLCNTTGASPTALGHAVADIYLAPLEHNDRVSPSVPVDAATLKAEAGLYVSSRDHSLLAVAYSADHLRMGATVMQPISPTSFVTEGISTAYDFLPNPAGTAPRLRITDPFGARLYDKVEPAIPTPADLKAFLGEYTSDEAEVAFKLTLEQGTLILHRRPDTVIRLLPTYRDAFTSTLGSVRFLRDANSQVTGISIGEDRVWDLRLNRVAGN